MPARLSRWLAALKLVLRSWYTPAALGILLLIAFAIWIMPTRNRWLVSPDGQHRRVAGDVPPRQILWEPPAPIEGLLPDAKPGNFLTPRLADGGSTLYFSYRPKGGHADIYRSRLVHGRWQQAEPVTELNTSADELGAVVS